MPPVITHGAGGGTYLQGYESLVRSFFAPIGISFASNLDSWHLVISHVAFGCLQGHVVLAGPGNDDLIYRRIEGIRKGLGIGCSCFPYFEVIRKHMPLAGRSLARCQSPVFSWDGNTGECESSKGRAEGGFLGKALKLHE